MNKLFVNKQILLLEREIHRINIKLHQPNTLPGFEILLKRKAVCEIERGYYIKILNNILSVKSNMTKTKKVNKLKKAVTAKSKKLLKGKKK